MKLAFPITRVPLRMFFNQRVVPGRVIGDPVQNNAHAQGMGSINKRTKVLFGTELRVHAKIVFDRVRAA